MGITCTPQSNHMHTQLESHAHHMGKTPPHNQITCFLYLTLSPSPLISRLAGILTPSLNQSPLPTLRGYILNFAFIAYTLFSLSLLNEHQSSIFGMHMFIFGNCSKFVKHIGIDHTEKLQ